MRTRATLIALAALAVVAVAGNPYPARAADLAGAKTFLVWLYAHYPLADNARFDPIGRSAAEVFDSPMIALIKEDARLTPEGDVGTFDGDPICDCQDDAGLEVKNVEVHGDGASAATATVTFGLADDVRKVRFSLVQVYGRWRIHDIAESWTPSLRNFLIQSNAKAAREGAARR